ncbi:MAG: dephospho-CoA kinase [Bacteroidales bacterium]
MAICFVCTGGIGSGKTYTVKIFNSLGIPAYIADERAKELYKSDKMLLNNLVKLLGEEIVSDGRLNKQAMAAKIFPDSTLLSKVNEIVHPRVLEDYKLWKAQKEQKGFKVVLFESAIFFEAPLFHSIADKIIVVTAPYDVRLSRVMERDNLSEQSVKERMARQFSDQERVSRADFIIFANGKRAVLPQVIEILNRVNYFDSDK